MTGILVMSDKLYKIKPGVGVVFGVCTILCIITIVIILLLPTPQDNAYYDKMLAESGLDLSQMSFSVEHRYCEDKWIDAEVYFELKVRGDNVKKVMDLLRGFPRYGGTIDIRSAPSWWKPDPSATKIVYYTNQKSASPIFIICITPFNKEYFTIYIAAIPV